MIGQFGTVNAIDCRGENELLVGELGNSTYWNSTYRNSTSVVIWIAPLRLLATGHLSACISSTRATVSRTSFGFSTCSLYFTWIRRMMRIPPSFSTSPTTSAMRSSGLSSIARAPSAPANVPVSQPPAAATT